MPGLSVCTEDKPPLKAAADAWRRRLPPRYGTDLWDMKFRERLAPLLADATEVLDVGSGRRPTIVREARRPGTTYVGLDVDGDELDRAAPGSYTETVVSPIEQRLPALESRFDLIVSFFVLEHVRSTELALASMRAYLKDGGTVVAQFAGARSPFSIANRLLGLGAARWLLRHTHARTEDSVFPARYDRCSYSELVPLLAGDWTRFELVPLFVGAPYVLFSRTLSALYVPFEDWAVRTHRVDLAPYYLLVAQR